MAVSSVAMFDAGADADVDDDADDADDADDGLLLGELRLEVRLLVGEGSVLVGELLGQLAFVEEEKL